MIKIQKFKNLFDFKRGSSLSFVDFITFIKTHRPEADISFIKEINKEAYQKAKNALPCVALNFNFGECRKTKNIIRPTGLIYFDIDDCEFDIETLDKSLIHAYWRSLSGEGYGLVVRADGANSSSHSDYSAQISHLANELDILDVYDKRAAKRNQGVCVPNDENIFYNKDSKLFKIGNIKSIAKSKVFSKSKLRREEKKRNNKVCLKVTLLNKLTKPNKNGARQIFLDNRHHFDIGDLAYERVEGSELIEVNMFGFKEGSRNSTVSCALKNAVWLNYSLDVNVVAKIVYGMMNASSEANLPEEEFRTIVDKVVALKSCEELQPIVSKKAYFMVFQGDMDGHKANGLSKVDKTIERFKAAIRSWPADEKLVVTKLVKLVGLSAKTYYAHRKEIHKQIEMEDTTTTEHTPIAGYIDLPDGDSIIVRAHEVDQYLKELETGELVGEFKSSAYYRLFWNQEPDKGD